MKTTRDREYTGKNGQSLKFPPLLKKPENGIFSVTVMIVLYLVLVPIIFLLYQSFRTPSTLTITGQWTLGNYLQVYGGFLTLELLRNSVVFALGSSIVAIILGTLLAWIVERTNTPFRSVLYALALLPLIIPGVLFTISWIFLLSPQIGIINQILMWLFGLTTAPFNIYSMGGMVWVEGLNLSPIAFLLITSAFRSMDPSLEEAARVCGANIFKTFWRITLKITWPAIFAVFLIVFVRAIEAFELPALVGLPAGIKVLTSEIYLAISQRYPAQYGIASTYAILLLIITTIGVFYYGRLTRDQAKYSTITGKGFRMRVIDLGRWKYIAMAFFMVYFTLVIFLPVFVLVWSSLQPYYAVPSLEALSRASLENYKYIMEYPKAIRSFWNSFYLAIATASVVMLLTAIISWITVKSKIRYRWLLDNLAFLPIVVPGLVLGVALMIVYLHLPFPIYGTFWILLIAYVTRCIPYGMRFNSTSMLQIHPELEESAHICGASWWVQFSRITVPLLKPGLIAGWIYVVIVSIRELSASILLYSQGTQVFSVVIWELWYNGNYVAVSALGVMLILTLFLIVVVARGVSKRFGVNE